jgi:signal transduction histidine kinase
MAVVKGASMRKDPRGNGRRSTETTIDCGAEVVRLRGFAGFLLSAQEAEQRRISREIHDDLGQKLALLEIQVEKMKRTPASGARLVLELESLRGSVAGLVEDLHRICHCLYPVILDTLGLAAGIEALCGQYTRIGGIAVKFVRGDIPPAPSGISLFLYRVVQEALHNIAKHSRARRATVTLCGSSAGIQVMIRDAGVGFDLARAGANHGLGLISLGERVRLLGGRCEIRSKPGRGTRIVAVIPLSPSVAGSDVQMSRRRHSENENESLVEGQRLARTRRNGDRGP